MKKLLKILLGLILVGLVAFGIVYLVYNEEKPVGIAGPEAERLTDKMLSAINHSEYLETDFIEWNFVGQHSYKWNKKENIVEVRWNDKEVLLNTKKPFSSIVKKPSELDEDDRTGLINTAQKYFNNDSFWLVAPHKIRDSGTTREVVKYDGQDALLVTYSSGGDTPGDSYLWILDQTGRPTAFKMWVKIVPIGGLEASWTEWIKTDSGTLLPTKHEIFFATLELTQVKAY